MPPDANGHEPAGPVAPFRIRLHDPVDQRKNLGELRFGHRVPSYATSPRGVVYRKLHSFGVPHELLPHDDVVTVGGGIAGSGLATVLSRGGLRGLVLETTEEFPDRTRGEWIAPWEVLDARRVGLEGDIRKARGHTISRHISDDDTRTPELGDPARTPSVELRLS